MNKLPSRRMSRLSETNVVTGTAYGSGVEGAIIIIGSDAPAGESVFGRKRGYSVEVEPGVRRQHQCTMIILWVGKEHVRTGAWGMRKLTLLAGWSKEYERNKVVSVVCQKRVACVVLKGVIDCLHRF